MYIRLTFLEKKVSIMESILVDARVALDSIMMENTVHPAHVPIAHTPGVHVSPPVPIDASESEEIPEEKFYSSVLDQAHEQAQDLSGAEAPETVPAEAALASLAVPAAPMNFTAMSRRELFELATKRGLRAKKSMNHAELVALLRRSESAQNATVVTGTENASEPTGAVFQGGAALDGSVSMGDGQAGASLD